ncbi:MAG TPA: hypothetical protein VGB52_03160 [Actinomycetota bacterium]
MAERRKTTMYVDADLLRAMKVAAAREDKPEYLVVEDALRKHLGFDLLERILARASLSEEAAMEVAIEATRSARKEIARERRRGSAR